MTFSKLNMLKLRDKQINELIEDKDLKIIDIDHSL